MTEHRQAPFALDDEPVLRWQLGPVRVTRVVEGVTTFPVSIFLPGLTDQHIAACAGWADPYLTADHSGLRLSAHSFIVETPTTTIVVDTCVGTHRPQIMGTDPTFLERLTATLDGGREAVDAVVCTHLHFDHVGVNTVRADDGTLRPTFPNARYFVSTAELEATLADDHMGIVDDHVQPLLDAECLDAVAPDHRIDEWVSLMPTPGHSPGHVCVRIDTPEGSGLITGDATHSPLQFTYPEVSAEIADHDSDEATRSRQRLLDDLVGTDTVVLGTHFPTPTAGRLVDGELVTFDPVDHQPTD